MLAHRVLVEDRPATPHLARQVVGQVDLDRRLAAAELLGVKDLLGGLWRIAEGGVDRRPVAVHLDAAHELETLECREDDLRLDDGRDARERLLRLRVGGRGDELRDLLGGQVLLQPVRHGDVGIALDQ